MNSANFGKVVTPFPALLVRISAERCHTGCDTFSRASDQGLTLFFRYIYRGGYTKVSFSSFFRGGVSPFCDTFFLPSESLWIDGKRCHKSCDTFDTFFTPKGVPMSDVIDFHVPLNLRAEFVLAVANARLRGELTDIEWQILIDEVCKK